MLRAGSEWSKEAVGNALTGVGQRKGISEAPLEYKKETEIDGSFVTNT
jgi:hypothetical protein